MAAKWLLLGAATWLALTNAKLMGGGTAIGRAWTFFGLGVGAFLAGELGEAFYQFGLGILNPFPSLLDVFYVAGYPLLIAGLLGFVRAYAGAAIPWGRRAARPCWGVASSSPVRSRSGRCWHPSSAITRLPCWNGSSPRRTRSWTWRCWRRSRCSCEGRGGSVEGGPGRSGRWCWWAWW